MTAGKEANSVSKVTLIFGLYKVNHNVTSCNVMCVLESKKKMSAYISVQ